MQEQTSWKGHTFTLLVFAGIVVLCSIFFTLGMLVGRTQGQKLASADVSDESSNVDTLPVEEERPELTFYDSVDDTHLSNEFRTIAKPGSTPPAPPPSKVQPPVDAVNYQIAALSKSSDAEKLLKELKQKNFKAFIVAPVAGDANRLYRVQVGPFSEKAEAELVKRKLESAGYKPIVKK